MDDARKYMLIAADYGLDEPQMIKTFTIDDIKFIIFEIFSFYPKTYEEYRQIDVFTKIVMYEDLFNTICGHLENYDAFEYLFNYITNNCTYVICGFNNSCNTPFNIICMNNYNYKIFKLYLNYIVDNYSGDELIEILNQGLYDHVYNPNIEIFQDLLQLVTKYDLQVFIDDSEFNQFLYHLVEIPNDLLYDFLNVLLHTSHKEKHIHTINYLLQDDNEDDDYYQDIFDRFTQEKRDYVQKLLDYILNNNNIKSAE